MKAVKIIEDNTTTKPLNQNRMEKPKQLEQINLDELIKICQEYIDFIDNDEEYYEDNDFDQYIFEKAMETIFGENVFEYINKRQD